jgi:hypothetical protein
MIYLNYSKGKATTKVERYKIMKYVVIDTEQKVFPTYFRTKKEALAYIEEQNNNTKAIAKGERLQVVKR